MEDYDELGYPSEEALDEIQKWPIGENWNMLLARVEELWSYESYVSRDEEKEHNKHISHWRFVTGGWSGNESLIGALQENRLFWRTCWWLSQRGGAHEFKVPN